MEAIAEGRGAPAGTAALGKAMVVLDVVATSETAPTFGELARCTGLPRGTLHRLLAAWIDKRMIAPASEDGSYRPGPHLLELARLTWERMDVRGAAAPPIAALHARTQETIHLAILSDAAIVHIDKVESTHPLRLHSAIGKRGPVHCTAVGKVMAAYLDPTEQRTLVDRLELTRHTPATLVSKTDLLLVLGQIRKAGLAFDHEEHQAGIHCVAAPVFDFRGRCVGGISITAPRVRVDVRTLRRYGEWLRDCAAETSRRLGGAASGSNSMQARGGVPTGAPHGVPAPTARGTRATAGVAANAQAGGQIRDVRRVR